MKKAFYIAGPMRNYPEFNFPAFLEMEALLREWHPEAEIFNPAQADLERGFDPTGLTGLEPLDVVGCNLREVLKLDLAFICDHATHIYMLPGWSESKGATAERALALALGLKVEGAAA